MTSEMGWFVPLGGMALFLALAGATYWLGGRMAAPGEDSPGKREPYACGEDLAAGETQLSYSRFFRLALMFVSVHMAVLLLLGMPRVRGGRLLATAYLLGVAVCVDILVKEEED